MNSFIILFCFIVASFVGETFHTNYFNEIPTEIEILFLLAVSIAVLQDVFKLRYHMKMVQMADRELKSVVEDDDDKEIHPPLDGKPA